MGYAIVGYFDKETDEVIRELWKFLMMNGIDDYLYNSKNNPHIKFIMYENFDEAQGIDAIKSIANQTNQIDVM